jgi:hypothetical protein
MMLRAAMRQRPKGQLTLRSCLATSPCLCTSAASLAMSAASAFCCSRSSGQALATTTTVPSMLNASLSCADTEAKLSLNALEVAKASRRLSAPPFLAAQSLSRRAAACGSRASSSLRVR